jgi:hypothetical protein
MVRDAVLAGAGAVGKQDGPPVEIWALHSSRRLVGVKVRAFFEVLQQTFPKKVFSALR